MATFTNQATLRYNGNVVNSNITTGELLEVLSATKTTVINTYNQESDITVTETVTPESGAKLTVAKSVCPRTITENSRLTYTFVIQNVGNTPAATYTQDSTSGEWIVEPGVSVLTVTGTV